MCLAAFFCYDETLDTFSVFTPKAKAITRAIKLFPFYPVRIQFCPALLKAAACCADDDVIAVRLMFCTSLWARLLNAHQAVSCYLRPLPPHTPGGTCNTKLVSGFQMTPLQSREYIAEFTPPPSREFNRYFMPLYREFRDASCY